ncbi:MAG: hypothetical protein ACREA0_14790, partial [bacterium]
MKERRCRAVLCIAVAILLAPLAPARLVSQSTAPPALPDRSQRVDGWRYDITWWLGQLRELHYLYRSRGLPQTLQGAAAELSRNVRTYSDQRMVVEMQRLAALAGDGHTYVLPVAQQIQTRALPVRLYLFADGLYVVDAQAGWEQWIGTRLERIGDT